MAEVDEIRRLPDGRVLVRWDDGSIEERPDIARKKARGLLPEGMVSYEEPEKQSLASTLVGEAGAGASLGLTPNITGVVGALSGKTPGGEAKPFWDRYRSWRDATAGLEAERQRQHPIASPLARMAGALPTEAALAAVGVPAPVGAAAQGAVMGAAYSPGDLTKGEVGKVGWDAAKGAGLSLGTYAVLNKVFGGARGLAQRGAGRREEALRNAMLTGQKEAEATVSQAAGSLGAATQDVNRMTEFSKILQQQAEHLGQRDAAKLMTDLRATPTFQEEVARAAQSLNQNFPSSVARRKATELAFDEARRTAGSTAFGAMTNAIPALTQGGHPELRRMAVDYAKRYGEPVLGRLAGGAAGAVGGYFAANATDDPMLKSAIGAGSTLLGAGIGGAFDRTRLLHYMSKRMAAPGVSYEVGDALARSRILNNWLTRDPSMTARLGSLAERAITGDRQAQIKADYLLSQLQPGYREDKAQLPGSQAIPEVIPELGF